ncbi:hypothetical protein C475_08116 [Halosimplex carlsbadense 2-9-1]|uniref:Uncharacterized protein n=1 Tax=Halosimplex carlsbadense 2-9-1 TaxID=797114 RepID=M0CYB7_9EURY|nr:hypothetical protein [Halosimplex carlsbadense]ELZ26884.1 hypothetical protein C475_08116 [Halosimplex carlsbadense 2-9-1]
MSREDTSYGTAERERDEQSSRSDGEGERASGVASRVREYAKSGTLAGVLGGAAVLRGLRSLRAGERARGVGRVVVGGALLAVAAVQRRAGREPTGERIDIDQSDVVDTGPDIDAVGESGNGTDHVGGEAASDVVDTAPDIDDAVDGTDESETGTDATLDASETGGAVDDVESDESRTDDAEPTESVASDRLGEAAFDEHSSEVPVPQEAFNREYLPLGGEVHWGVRDDGRVVVSGRFDPIEGGHGVTYVASTAVDDDRFLAVPDEVTDHWDDVSGGPMAVEGGDGIVFATNDDLTADDQLLAVPAAWAEDALGEE